MRYPRMTSERDETAESDRTVRESDTAPLDAGQGDQQTVILTAWDRCASSQAVGLPSTDCTDPGSEASVLNAGGQGGVTIYPSAASPDASQ
jgi:hypothetical protein